jgi:glucose/mannose-6-phosphate isomerase
MLEHLIKFPAYVRKGYSLGKDFKIKGKINKILVCGMGGSGVSGDILQDYFDNIPVFVNKSYDIPGFVDKNTLAVVISYSGNTEETISAYEKVKEKTKKRLVIASGGILGGEKNVIKVPLGLPPRYSLPFLFFSMLRVLNNSKIVEKDFDLEELVNNLKSINHDETKTMAKSIIGCYPLIYAPEGYGSVAYRWQTQFNENSKLLAHSQVFSEHNHNEIEATKTYDWQTIMLRDPKAHERINKRMDIFAEPKEYWEHRQVWLKGRSKLSKMFYGILYGDLVTYYLALERGNDPAKQDKIDDLKEKLKH